MTHSTPILPGAPSPIHPQAVLEQLKESPEAYQIFLNLPPNKRREFLDFCCGRTSLYLCYDVFFRRIFDPFIHRERLERLISSILNQDIEILEIIPNEGFHMSDRGSFVIFDIVVRLSDHTILNIEIQKSGYKFPGKRFDCYCADLIMREYNRLRELKGKKFSYRDMPRVLSIALIESSTQEFYRFPDQYIHHVQMQSDTGIQVENLPQHIYVSLDIFRLFMQNKAIETPREAWLTLLTTQNLTRIEELIQKFPDFADIYREVFELRTDPKELITMFSEVLLEGDRNMERLMIDEWREELQDLKQEAQDLKQEAQDLKQEAQDLKQEAQDLKLKAQDKELEIQTVKEENQAMKLTLSEKDSCITEKDARIAELEAELRELNKKG